MNNAKNTDIFRTKLQYFITYKWEHFGGKHFMMLYALIYIIETCLIVAHMFSKEIDMGLIIITEKWVIFCLTLLSFILFGLEIIQLFSVDIIYDYFTFWNLVDFCGQLSQFLYGALKEAEKQPVGVDGDDKLSDSYQGLAFFASILIFTKTTSMLRINSDMSYLIKMIIEVFAEMYSFLVIMFFYALFIAVLIYYIYLQKDNNNSHLGTIAEDENPCEPDNETKFFTNIWLVSYLGSIDMENDNSTSYALFLFLLTSMFSVVVLLNLLIAIISDVFDRVQDQRVSSQMKERCNLMLDIE